MSNHMLIVTPENVIEAVILHPIMGTIKKLRRLAIEAEILKMTSAPLGDKKRLAAEAYACVTKEVIEEIETLCDIRIYKRDQVQSGRVMETIVYRSDRTGLSSTLSTGLGRYGFMCPYMDGQTLRITWFN